MNTLIVGSHLVVEKCAGGCTAHSPAAGSLLLAIAALFVLAGCNDGSPSSPGAPPPNSSAARASVALKVLVVNDGELATAIERLRGEWAERSGGKLSAESRPWTEVVAAPTLDADVIIFPLRYLGELVETKRLRPMRDSSLNSQLYNADDVMPLAREKLGVYGGQAFALPLSVEMPLHWAGAAADASGNGGPSWWPPEESVEHWPAIILLARAAAYATHPRQEAVLFDPQTVAAQLGEPPFVRALEEWQAERKAGPVTTPRSEDDSATSFEVPESDELFNRSTGEWEKVSGGPRHVPLLAGGQLLAVTASSRNAASAFELATWLASAETAMQLWPGGRRAMPVRRSQLGATGRWADSLGERVDKSRATRNLQSGLNEREALVILRIPGTDEYLAALAECVNQVLAGNESAAEGLVGAARKWDTISDRLGRESQRRAYLRDLGIEEP